MNELVLHPHTAAALAAFQASPSHALILSGPPGSGKLSVAIGLSEVLLELVPGSFSAYAYGRTITPADGKSIGIEAVRELEHFLSLKVPLPRPINRAIVIADGHLLTTEAQNALLKTIEEPPTGTILLITTANEQALLPTIRSRSQHIAVKRPETGELATHFAARGAEPAAVKRAMAMSGGLPGLTQALLGDDDHPLRAAALKARELLGQTAFERLIHVDELAQQKNLCTDTLFIMQQMAVISLPAANGSQAKRWQTVLRSAHDAQAALAGGAQAKLVLTNFMLAL